jgi:hypothetical protein
VTEQQEPFFRFLESVYKIAEGQDLATFKHMCLMCAVLGIAGELKEKGIIGGGADLADPEQRKIWAALAEFVSSDALLACFEQIQQVLDSVDE